MSDTSEQMRDIPGMTVRLHHELCIGVMAGCFKHVPDDLKAAILEACESAQKMGMNIEPDNLFTGEPLHKEIRMTSE